MKTRAIRLALGFAFVFCVAQSAGIITATGSAAPTPADAVASRALADIVQQGKLTASDGVTHDQLGWSVAASGNTLVVGVPYADIVVDGALQSDRGAVYVFTKPDGGTWANATQAKLVASDGAQGDLLGYTVTVEGDTIVALAPYYSRPGQAGVGSGYVFTKPAGGWVNAVESGRLFASDGMGWWPWSDAFGNSVDMSGDTIVVGVPAQNFDKGAVYVFKKPAGGWAGIMYESAKLGIVDEERRYFAYSVAVDGDTIVAGALNHVGSNSYQGSVYVFSPGPGGSWLTYSYARLLAADGASNDNLGIDVDIEGDTIVAGARHGGNWGEYGAVYVFTKPEGGWVNATHSAKLTATLQTSVSLGSSVVISGNTIVAGAPLVDLGSNYGYAGAAFVFTKPAGNPWVDVTYDTDPSLQPIMLTSSPLVNYSFFGNGVALSGGTVFIGHPGDDGIVTKGSVSIFGDDAPPPPDTDSDGVADDQDNCPSVANAGQDDDDDDSVGNACDPDFAKLSIADASTDEGNIGFGNLSFVVTMTSPRAVDVAVQYQTANVTASDGSDYTGASSVLTIPAGQTTGTINVAIAREVAHESDETFTVELFNATNATIDDGLATGTIVNDDAQVCLVTSPLLEYRFNGTGTTSPSTGTDNTPVTFKHPAGTVVDLHAGPGSGVSGLAGDVAFNNTQQVNDGVFGDFGHGGYGDRAEQLVDDENADGLASVTFQGWFKSNDPTSVTGNGGILFNKADGVEGGGGFGMRWNDGRLSAGFATAAGAAGAETGQSYFSGNQWIFFAVTYDSSTSSNNLKFYQGTTSQAVALVHTASVPAGLVLGSADRLVLGNGSNAVRAFPALFDNMRMFTSKTADSGALTIGELEAYRSADLQNSDQATVGACDSTPPTVTPTVAGTEGNEGWHVSDVTVSWSVVDNESSISVSTGCDETSITTDTAGITLTCSATSIGGTTTESVTIKRDGTAPEASAAASPSANAAGWHNAAVTVSFSGTDALSGLASCDPAVVLSTDGTNLSASGRCYDAAGNASAPATAGGINIDTVAPTAVASAGPPPNAAGWRRNNVTVSFSGTDALSGIASCDPSITLSTEGTNLGASGQCYDVAGNPSAPATASGINIDKTNPVISIVSPAQSATYNRNQLVLASYSCSDLLSGVATCVGPAPNGAALDTSKKAPNAKFTVTATDKAGNSVKLTVTYSVK